MKIILSKLCKTSTGHGFWVETNFKRVIYSYKTLKQAGDARQKFIDDNPTAKVL